MNDRQAVIVEHRDRKHSHVHIVVNRVSPEDGRAASAGQDQIKLKNWAKEYERDQGRIRCQRRIDSSIKPQRRQGPDRMPRSRAHRRAWSNLYKRQRKELRRKAAATLHRKGRSGKLDQPHLLQRAKLARKIERDVAKYQRRLEHLAAVTEAARTRVNAVNAAIDTVARKVAAAITPEPRTDAERNQIALAHTNKPDRPTALSVVPAAAATDRTRSAGSAIVEGARSAGSAIVEGARSAAAGAANQTRSAGSAALTGTTVRRVRDRPRRPVRRVRARPVVRAR